MNESDTRLHKIDPKLKATGWGVTEGIQAMRVIPSGSFSSGCMHSQEKRCRQEDSGWQPDGKMVIKKSKAVLIQAK